MLTDSLSEARALAVLAAVTEPQKKVAVARTNMIFPLSQIDSEQSLVQTLGRATLHTQHTYCTAYAYPSHAQALAVMELMRVTPVPCSEAVAAVIHGARGLNEQVESAYKWFELRTTVSGFGIPHFSVSDTRMCL